jgi:hypothetical protein
MEFILLLTLLYVLQTSVWTVSNSILFYLFLLGYIHCTGNSLWQFWISLHCTLVRSPPLPQTPPAPLKAITRGFFFLFCGSIWNPSTIFPYLNLLHSPSSLPQVPPLIPCWVLVSQTLSSDVSSGLSYRLLVGHAQEEEMCLSQLGRRLFSYWRVWDSVKKKLLKAIVAGSYGACPAGFIAAEKCFEKVPMVKQKRIVPLVAHRVRRTERNRQLQERNTAP